MSAYDMYPKFGTHADYRAWRASWASLYRAHTKRIRSLKTERANLQWAIAQNERDSSNRDTKRRESLAKVQRKLAIERVMGHKMMTLLEDAKIRAKRIYDMQISLRDQAAGFPLTIEAPSFDFHFNKISIEFPFMPMWTIKSKGKTYYVNHLDAEGVTMTTRETPEHPATKGAIRFRRGILTINEDGTASLRPAQPKPIALPEAA